jgi:hypothetical protein
MTIQQYFSAHPVIRAVVYFGVTEAIAIATSLPAPFEALAVPLFVAIDNELFPQSSSSSPAPASGSQPSAPSAPSAPANPISATLTDTSLTVIGTGTTPNATYILEVYAANVGSENIAKVTSDASGNFTSLITNNAGWSAVQTTVEDAQAASDTQIWINVLDSTDSTVLYRVSVPIDV